MCCGPRLTAVAVGLSVVVLDDEEVKTPASMACRSHSKDCYCYIYMRKRVWTVSYQKLYLYCSDNA